MNIIVYKYKNKNKQITFLHKNHLVHYVYDYLNNDLKINCSLNSLYFLNINVLLYLGNLSKSCVKEYRINDKFNINLLKNDDLKYALWNLTNQDINNHDLQNSFNILLMHLINYQELIKIILKIYDTYLSEGTRTTFDFMNDFKLSTDQRDFIKILAFKEMQ